MVTNMENKLVVEEKIEETLTIEEVNKTPEIEIEAPQIEAKVEKVKVPAKVNKSKKPVKKTEEKPAVPKPVRIEITEKLFLKAMKKVKKGEEICITPLYQAYDKSGDSFKNHTPSKVKTKIRAFGKTLVEKGIIKMVRAKQGNYFVYKLVK